MPMHVTEQEKTGNAAIRWLSKEKKGHRKENSTIKPEIPADENQQRIKRKCDEHFKKSSNEPDQEAERLNDKLFIESLILAQDERWRYA